MVKFVFANVNEIKLICVSVRTKAILLPHITCEKARPEERPSVCQRLRISLEKQKFISLPY